MTSGKPIIYPELYYLHDIMWQIGTACAKSAAPPRRARRRGGAAARRSAACQRRCALIAAPCRRRRFTELFRVAPLPRWRAVFALVCAGAAFLCAGGMLEYGTGSPETQGSAPQPTGRCCSRCTSWPSAAPACSAAFPALARPPIKLAWLALVAAVYGFAFVVWYRQQPEGTPGIGDWLARWPAYAPPSSPLVIGLCLCAPVVPMQGRHAWRAAGRRRRGCGAGVESTVSHSACARRRAALRRGFSGGTGYAGYEVTPWTTPVQRSSKG